MNRKSTSRTRAVIACETANASPLVDWAADILVKQWSEWFGEVELVRASSTRWAIRLDGADPSAVEDRPRLHHDGYAIESDESGRAAVFARSADGLKNGIFGLLREFGCGFYFGGEAVPAKPWRTSLPPGLRKIANPRFSTRGLLPFHNFSNGPTCWEPEDYRRYFDLMSAQGLNLAMLHTYDYEPHGAYRFRGRWLPDDLRRDHVRYRGKESLEVAAFPRSVRACFPFRRFGPPDVRDTRTVEECVEKSQGLLREAFAHARVRGVRTCFSFELRGDPRSAEIRARFLARIDHVLATYEPDFLGLWQKENIGQIGWTLPLEGSGWEAEWRAKHALVENLGARRRGLEALRIAEFLNVAHAHLKKRRTPARLVLGGWGGDEWMLMPEMFAALDALVPKDVIFTALENLDVNQATTVSAGFGGLPATRERWPIPWLEADAGLHPSQWHPQASVGDLAPIVSDAVKKKCDGVLGLHWRFSGEVEWEIARFAQACWREETDTGFWRDFSARCFGRQAGNAFARELEALNALGPGWTGLAAQIECVPFTWESIPELVLPAKERSRWKRFQEMSRSMRPVVIRHSAEARKPISLLDALLFFTDWTAGSGADPAVPRQSLERIRARLEKVARNVVARTWPRRGRERFEDLMAMIDFVQRFDRVARLMKPGGAVHALREEAALHRSLGAKKHASLIARRALALMRKEPFEKAIAAYARQVRTTSQRGNLARMCDEALPAWEETRRTLREIAGNR